MLEHRGKPHGRNRVLAARTAERVHVQRARADQCGRALEEEAESRPMVPIEDGCGHLEHLHAAASAADPRTLAHEPLPEARELPHVMTERGH